MYCKNCGKDINDSAVVCPNCGVSVEQPLVKIEDRGGFAWGLLGCCVPIAGLILFLIWRDTKPKTAKAAAIGGAICIGCIVAFYIITFILGFIFVDYTASQPRYFNY